MAFLVNNNSIAQSRNLIPLNFTVINHPKNILRPYPKLPNHLVNHSHSRTTIAASSVSDAVDVHTTGNQKSFSSSTTTNWTEFAGNVSGEWDGFGADFSSKGQPIELPQSVVPEAYREWEVKVFDWQTQCPTLARLEEQGSIFYKLIRLLPTVGCEADAAMQYSIHTKKIRGEGEDIESEQVSAFAYHPTGCYVAVWLTDERLLELEHCLVNPHNRESRVRIIQVLRINEGRMSLEKIRVFREQWYGPFRNGEQLGGCAIRNSAFASTEAMEVSQVTGVWRGSLAVASFPNSNTNIMQELVGDNSRMSRRDECDLIMLPKQLWCSLKESEHGDTCGEVGWLLDHGYAISSRCIFSTEAKLKEIRLGQETAVLDSNR